METAQRQVTAYTPDDYSRAAMEYANTGNIRRTARALDIPHTTIASWKNDEGSVFNEVLEQCRALKSEEHRQMYSQIVDQAQAKTLELLPEVKSAKEAAVISAVATDKLRLADGQSTRITGNTNDMQALAKQFADLSQQWTEKQVNVVKTIDSTDDSTNENENGSHS